MNDNIQELLDNYLRSSSEEVIKKALRRSMYGGIMIGFLSGLIVGMYLFLMCWRI
jgi:hypothetical protein